MTGERVTEIRERLDAATPGPWWRAYGSEAESADPVKDKAKFLTLALNDSTSPLWLTSNGDVIPAVTGDGPNAKDNAELIANAPADLAYLLDALAARDAALARVEALHRRDGDFDCCTTCYNLANDGYEPWPCPTIAALSGTNQEGKRDE